MDDHERQIIADIDRYGWHVVLVREEDDAVPFAHTIGLFHSYQHPEVIIFGLGLETMHHILNLIGEETKTGRAHLAGTESDTILERYSCAFRHVAADYYAQFFGLALWYYKHAEFPAVQCVWPDTAGHYPWDSASTLYRSTRQPLLDTDDEPWPFDQAPNVAAITTRHVLAGAPILHVTHYADDHSWGFLCGTTNDTDDGRVMSMENALRMDPTLRQIANLPPGWCAWREDTNAPWQRYPNPDV